ncbi:MAG TPA: DUF58 domain-containing protein [Candidatus Brachybacterium merdigallinarum]|nr:DUF58 domain-containing protein [Candidatus Brachybacterium merdigallinarum]
MTGRAPRVPTAGLRVRPTARGVICGALAAALWILADLFVLTPARTLAAALLMALAVGAICILLSLVGLRAQRRLREDAVPVGTRVQARIDLPGSALITILPLGRASVRQHLPDALGGEGDLALKRHLPHGLQVTRRGRHPLGPFSLVVRDLFGLFHARRTIIDDLQVVGIPAITTVGPFAIRQAGIAPDGTLVGAGPGTGGDIGPLARPYVSGDDMRRVHWRASARAGALMTREDEPAAAHTAVIVLDTSRREDRAGHDADAVDAAVDRAVEDRAVSHAATLLDSLTRHGWRARIVDASGDEITPTLRTHEGGGASLASLAPSAASGLSSALSAEAEAVSRRAMLLALAEIDFDDTPENIGRDHAAGDTSLAIAIGIDDASPFSRLDLDRFAGRSTHRTAIALRSADPVGPAPNDAAPVGPASVGPASDGAASDGAGPEDLAADGTASAGAAPVGPTPQRSMLGSWVLVRGTDRHSLDELLTAAGRGGGA